MDDIENLREELEEIPTLYTIDLVGLEECQNNLLLEDIEKYGRKILRKDMNLLKILYLLFLKPENVI